MLRQLVLIDRVRELCVRDERVVAALMYGSFLRGEGDAYSDIEFYTFWPDAILPRLDREAWLGAIAPLRSCFANEFGTTVAIFDDWIRGEFHFEPLAAIASVRAWPLAPGDAVAMQILDREGRLHDALAAAEQPRAARPTAEVARELSDRLLNWLLLGTHVLRRGEYARALDALSQVQRFLLWLARVREDARDQHWLTPSRAAEADLSAEIMARFARCTAPLDPVALAAAYEHAWHFARDLSQDARFDAALAELPAWLSEVSRR
jgi:lincosamide nucleotidyltransferase